VFPENLVASGDKTSAEAVSAYRQLGLAYFVNRLRGKEVAVEMGNRVLFDMAAPARERLV
jgi:hypothetical protein